jgi:hypothetical protein
LEAASGLEPESRGFAGHSRCPCHHGSTPAKAGTSRAYVAARDSGTGVDPTRPEMLWGKYGASGGAVLMLCPTAARRFSHALARRNPLILKRQHQDLPRVCPA